MPGGGAVARRRGNLLRADDEEGGAADGDLKAVDRLISQLENRPTPSGQTPGELTQQRMLKK